MAPSSLTCTSTRRPTESFIWITIASSSSVRTLKTHLLRIAREILWIILGFIVPYERWIDICEDIKEDDRFKNLLEAYPTLADEIEAWSKGRPELDYDPHFGIYPKSTPFVLDFGSLFSENSLIANRHFEAMQSFLEDTEKSKMARHLEINTSVVERPSCPWVLLNVLWPCLREMGNLKTIDLVGNTRMEYHNICKDEFFIPEMKKGVKLERLTWYTAKHLVNGREIGKRNEEIELVGTDNGSTNLEGLRDLSTEFDNLQTEIVNAILASVVDHY